MSAGWTTAAADLPYRRGYGASCPGSFSPHRSRSGRCNAPFFSALHALAVDDAGRWAGLAPHRLAALHIERVMDAFERSVPCPQIEIVEQPAARRQILRHVTPLATRAVLGGPHRRPLQNQATDLESYLIHPIQLLFGRTLRRQTAAWDDDYLISLIAA